NSIDVTPLRNLCSPPRRNETMMSTQSPTLDYRSPTTRDVPTDRVNWREELGLLIVYLLLFAALSWLAWPYFLKVRNLLNILLAVSTIGIISVAMTMVIVSGGIDLSIGSVVALAGVI